MARMVTAQNDVPHCKQELSNKQKALTQLKKEQFNCDIVKDVILFDSAQYSYEDVKEILLEKFGVIEKIRGRDEKIIPFSFGIGTLTNIKKTYESSAEYAVEMDV